MNLDKFQFQRRRDIQRILGLRGIDFGHLFTNFLNDCSDKPVSFDDCYDIDLFRLWLENNDIPFEDQRELEG